MIVYDLHCREHAHRFEGWFGSSDDFARQQERGLVECPQCGSVDVVKAPMAPAVPRKGNQLPAPGTVSEVAAPPTASPSGQPLSSGLPVEVAQMMTALAQAQAEALKQSRWVGDKFAEQSRAIHYGESDPEPIHGQATPEEARALLDEGVEIMPLLLPVAPPGKTN